MTTATTSSSSVWPRSARRVGSKGTRTCPLRSGPRWHPCLAGAVSIPTFKLSLGGPLHSRYGVVVPVELRRLSDGEFRQRSRLKERDHYASPPCLHLSTRFYRSANQRRFVVLPGQVHRQLLPPLPSNDNGIAWSASFILRRVLPLILTVFLFTLWPCSKFFDAFGLENACYG
jgi:hypothetical protein